MKKLIAIITLVLLLCSTVALAHPFTDVSGHWAEEQIKIGYENKAINGDGDGKFRPDDTITRAEFIKMLTAEICGRTGVQIPEEFDDKTHWSAKYYNFARLYIYGSISETVEGVIPGIMQNAEEFELPISRWEMAFMLDGAAKNVLGLSDSEKTDAVFTDAEKIEKDFPEIISLSIKNCNGLSLMTGDEKGKFDPSAKGTRAEAITVINRFDSLITNVIKTLEEAQQKEQEAYINNIEENMVTYKEIPKGHPTATILMSDNKRIVIELYPEYAPQTVANFVKLAKDGFYNGLTFHRIVDGFIAQGGDPNGDGSGGSEKYILGEFLSNGVNSNTLSHQRGVVSMARSSHPDSASSQFFICYGDASFLDGQYAAFGKVTKGMDVVDGFTKVELMTSPNGEIATPKEPIVIKSITVK